MVYRSYLIFILRINEWILREKIGGINKKFIYLYVGNI